ncbi:MAG: SRPBCC family protein [Actinomycetota bacterium]|nr:SRPBCC family protein [Actinomycetota bacterium]MDA2971909.1 SRPBCC family protein [Actinomycetota bacterium]MDA3001427.1 SRPBCC family protein [Actinomycetota bacterium]
MGRITVSIDLNATPDRVWSIVEPIERHVDWMADAVAIRFETEQTRGVGTQFLCDTKVGPIKLTDHMRITEWVPGEAMGVEHTGLVTGTGIFTLAPLDEGRRTRFTWSEDLRFPWWLGGRLGELIGGNLVMKAIWRRNLTSLRRLVEGR